MSRAEIIAALDEEITKLIHARELIKGSNGIGPTLAKFVANGSGLSQSRSHRNMSAEGRKRIAEAQRLRWARQKAGK